jgi:hypothetical protein
MSFILNTAFFFAGGVMQDSKKQSKDILMRFSTLRGFRGIFFPKLIMIFAFGIGKTFFLLSIENLIWAQISGRQTPTLTGGLPPAFVI